MDLMAQSNCAHSTMAMTWHVHEGTKHMPVKSFSKVGRKAQIGRKTVYEIDPWTVYADVVAKGSF